MSIESIRRSFNDKMSAIERIKKRITQEEQEKSRTENDILHFERTIRDLEIQLTKAVNHIKKLRRTRRQSEKHLERDRKEIRNLLSDLEKLRKSIM